METTKNTFEFCPNCNFTLPDNAKYCPQCAQKRTDGRLTLGEMLNEFSDAVFNFDSKIFRTIASLFIPGKLTNQYFLGRHKRYIHPLRIFLILTVGLIAAATFELDNPDFIGIGEEIDRMKSQHERRALLLETDTLIQNVAKEFSNKNTQQALDSLSKRLFEGERKNIDDSLKLHNFIDFNFTTESPVFFAWEDIESLSPDTLINRYQIKGDLNRYLMKQQLRLAQRGENFGFYLIGNGSWMLFFMMPFLALVLKIVYIRRGYYYVEHLIFSFHAHSFAFLLYIVMILFGKHAPGWIIGGGFVLLTIYLYIALRRVYNQGRFKTLLKYGLISLMYFLILLFAVVLTAGASFALF